MLYFILALGSFFGMKKESVDMGKYKRERDGKSIYQRKGGAYSARYYGRQGKYKEKIYRKEETLENQGFLDR